MRKKFLVVQLPPPCCRHPLDGTLHVACTQRYSEPPCFGARLCCAAECTESARKSEWKETEVRCGGGWDSCPDRLPFWAVREKPPRLSPLCLNTHSPTGHPAREGGTFRRRSLAGGIASPQQCGYWVVCVVRPYFLFFPGFVTPEVCDQLPHVLQPFWSLRRSTDVTGTLPSYFVSGIDHDNKKSNNRVNA